MGKQVHFSGGRNIAIKVPPHLYEATVSFYRDILCLPSLESYRPAAVFEFGANQLWVDSVPGISQAETWLEIVTDDIPGAAGRLDASGVVRCDGIEALPKGLHAFWISNPAQIIHLVCARDESA